MTRTLEENLNVLQILDRDDLAAVIQQLPEGLRASAAAVAVRQEAPIRDAILTATYEELPSVVDRLLDMAAAR